jgi:alpha-ketoglutarate-dependent taurine dioxygenase
MTIQITPSGQACGAQVTGIDLSKPLSQDAVATLRSAWLDSHVLSFPDQALSDDNLEQFALYFGAFGEDPFIAPLPGREHVIAVKRDAGETAPIFAEAWHTDWSFQATPPAGTCLYGITIPKCGGDTLFSNQHLALTSMPDTLRQQLEGKIALHSARGAYSPDGLYGDAERDSDRSMEITPSNDAMQIQRHPIIRAHPETGQVGIFGCLGYIIGIEGMDNDEASALLLDLYQWQTRDEFQYRHPWQAGTLVMWDNRSVLHRASGGYEGFDRLLHRVTIAEGVGNSP